MEQHSATFTIADYLLLDRSVTGRETQAVFAVADYVAGYVPPPVVKPVAQFTVGDYILVTGAVLVSRPGNVALVLADLPLEFLPTPPMPDAVFSVGEYLRMNPDGLPGDAAFAVADYPRVDTSRYFPAHAAMVIADVNIIDAPSPEMLWVWDEPKQAWVHAPRWIYDASEGIWRLLS